MKTYLSTLLLITAWLANPSVAGEYNQVLSIGDIAPAWKDLEGTDGEKHSFSDVRSAAAIVVVFTCNSCPYAVDLEDRLKALAKRFDNKQVALVAINVNKIEEDALPAMKERAEEKAFGFPYLYDPTQKIARDYGAKYTPECFVLTPERKVVYMGSFDDSPDGKTVNQAYVTMAIESILTGATLEVSETVPIGCRIRFKRERGRSR